MPTDQLLHFASIDDYLGPGDSRFFSTGFRRVEHSVTGIVVTAADAAETGVQAIASLEYPRNWSRKKEEFDLPPHVSTVDAAILGVQLSEVFLAHAYGLDGLARRRARLRKLTVRAGTTPQEDLVDLPATARLRHTRADPGAMGGHVSVFETSVGAMRARCEIEHGIAGRAREERTFDSLDEVLGAAADRYYGDGFKSRRQLLTEVTADLGALGVEAQVEVELLADGMAAAEGIEGDRTPDSYSLIDCFVVNLQLTQVLLYELDSLNRRDSNTLWMLQTVLEYTGPGRRTGSTPSRARAAIVDKHLVPLRGGIWRNVDIVASLAGIDMRCSFAHELPSAAAASAS